MLAMTTTPPETDTQATRAYQVSTPLRSASSTMAATATTTSSSSTSVPSPPCTYLAGSIGGCCVSNALLFGFVSC